MNTTFMANNNICIGTEHRQLPSFYWLPKLQRNVVLNACLNYLLFASRKSQTISNNIVEVYIYSHTGVNCFWIVDNSQQVLSILNKINLIAIGSRRG